MTKIIIQIEREEDVKLLEAFAQRLALVYTQVLDEANMVNLSNKEWVNEINGSWTDFPESAEDLIAIIEQNKAIEALALTHLKPRSGDIIKPRCTDNNVTASRF